MQLQGFTGAPVQNLRRQFIIIISSSMCLRVASHTAADRLYVRRLVLATQLHNEICERNKAARDLPLAQKAKELHALTLLSHKLDTMIAMLDSQEAADWHMMVDRAPGVCINVHTIATPTAAATASELAVQASELHEEIHARVLAVSHMDPRAQAQEVLEIQEMFKKFDAMAAQLNTGIGQA
jgi:hypothetical protein